MLTKVSVYICRGFSFLIILLVGLCCAFFVVAVSHEKFTLRPIVTERTIKIIRETQIKADIDEEIYLYTFKPLFGLDGLSVRDGIRRDVTGKVIITLNEFIIFHYSDLALAGTINHEIGHLTMGHLNDGKGGKNWGSLSRTEQEKRQTEADLFAIKMVGREAVNAYLTTRGYNEKY